MSKYCEYWQSMQNVQFNLDQHRKKIQTSKIVSRPRMPLIPNQIPQQMLNNILLYWYILFMRVYRRLGNCQITYNNPLLCNTHTHTIHLTRLVCTTPMRSLLLNVDTLLDAPDTYANCKYACGHRAILKICDNNNPWPGENFQQYDFLPVDDPIYC